MPRRRPPRPRPRRRRPPLPRPPRPRAPRPAAARPASTPALGDDPRFVTEETRKAHEADLDALISAWAAGRDKWEVTHLLQARGVPAFPSLSPRELAADPHLEARGFLKRLEHP